jgi:hypothetical protein
LANLYGPLFCINSDIRSHFEVWEHSSVIYDTTILQLKAPRHKVCHVHITTLLVPYPIFITTVMWISGTQKEALGKSVLNRSRITLSIVRFWNFVQCLRKVLNVLETWSVSVVPEILRQYIHIVLSKIQYTVWSKSFRIDFLKNRRYMRKLLNFFCSK